LLLTNANKLKKLMRKIDLTLARAVYFFLFIVGDGVLDVPRAKINVKSESRDVEDLNDASVVPVPYV